MKPLTQLAHELIASALDREGVSRPWRAVDATAGNGHDTLFLAHLVFPLGHTWAIDRQQAALLRTRQRLQEAGIPVAAGGPVSLLLADHADLESLIPNEEHGRLAVVMFNLGYLPGSDQTVQTEPASTLRALSAAWRMLASGGVLSVLAYPGHPGGDDEAEAVHQWFRQLPASEIGWLAGETVEGNASPAAPQLRVVQKRYPAVNQ